MKTTKNEDDQKQRWPKTKTTKKRRRPKTKTTKKLRRPKTKTTNNYMGKGQGKWSDTEVTRLVTLLSETTHMFVFQLLAAKIEVWVKQHTCSQVVWQIWQFLRKTHCTLFNKQKSLLLMCPLFSMQFLMPEKSNSSFFVWNRICIVSHELGMPYRTYKIAVLIYF